MRAFSQAAFLGAFAELAALPPEGPREIAFAGRSNVGKSSAINALAGRRRLAHASRTPGRTQTINLYALGESGRLADLPGYGYARVPQALRARWDALAGGYLRERATLAGVVVLMDARRPFTPQDLQLLEWLRPRLGAGRVRLVVLLSKADKLPRAARAEALRQARRRLAELGLAAAVHACSTLSGEGFDALRAELAAWLRERVVQPE